MTTVVKMTIFFSVCKSLRKKIIEEKSDRYQKVVFVKPAFCSHFISETNRITTDGENLVIFLSGLPQLRRFQLSCYCQKSSW